MMMCVRKSAKVLLLLTVTLIGAQYLVNVLFVTKYQTEGMFAYYKNISVVFLQRTSVSNITRRNVTAAPRLEECPIIPPDIQGRVTVNTQIPSWAFLEENNSRLEPGGRHHPSDCIARNRVAIIIPFRDRETHLKIFLQNIHPFLQRQQIDYGIYVVELAADIKFNRALLMNVGFMEALKEHNYQCFIFHDVDLLPEDDRNLYTCPQTPRHMSVAIDRLKYKLPYTTIFGGVSAITKEHFETINGFSNLYFGWGGEDDDMYRRIRLSQLTVSRYSPKVARYKMLTHKKDNGNPQRFNLLKNMKRFKSEGLSSLNYTIIKKEYKRLYTWVLVRVNQTEIMKEFRIQNQVAANAQALAKAAALSSQHKLDTKQSNASNKQPVAIRKNPAQGGPAHGQRKPIVPPVKIVDWLPTDFKGVLPDYLNKYDIIEQKPKPKPAQQKHINNQLNQKNSVVKQPVVDTNNIAIVENTRQKKQNNQINVQQTLGEQKIPRPPKVIEQGIVVPVFRNSNTVIENSNAVIGNSNNNVPILGNPGLAIPKAVVIGEKEANGHQNIQYVIVDEKQAIPKPP